METIPWYQSAVIRQQIVQLIVAGLALFGIATDIDWSKTVEAIFAGIAAVVAIWTVITRFRKPHPNLSGAAVLKEQELRERGVLPRQAGFARVALMAILAFGSLTVATALTGCTQTREAYRAAVTLEERAYVVSEHYAALVNQAADLKERGILTGSALRRVQEVEIAARPVVLKLGPLVRALKDASTAENELQLQLALDESVRLIADLVRAIKGESA